MKNLLLFSILGLTLISCDFKDKNGNAPLIEDSNGNLIDNPSYETDQQIEYDEKMEPSRVAYKEVLQNDGSHTELKGKPTIEERERFASEFKPRGGKNDITLSGKDKTIIKFTGAFNTEYTLEQFDNLNYYSKMKTFGFTKVLFSNGLKIVATKKL